MKPIDGLLWVFGYKMASKSAQLLAKELDVYMIRHEGSEWKGRKGRYVLNWGAGTGVFNAKIDKDTVVFNRPEQVDLAINKRDFFKACLGDNAPRVPHWTVSKQQAKAWLSQGLTVIARTRLEGAKGDGLVVMKSPVDFVEAPLYTILSESTAEYRVYMFNGNVLDTRIKLLARDQAENPDNMRYEDKYEYCQLSGEPPEDVKEQARRAIKKIGLMTGGVDVLYDSKTGLATCLEVNSSPYLGGRTAEKYAKSFEKHVRALEAA